MKQVGLYLGSALAGLLTASLIVYFGFIRQPHYNALTPASDGVVATIENGLWLKGDLHLHSRHSKDSTNNPIRRIIGFAETHGFDFLAITDHDNHVFGDVAAHSWADPEFQSDNILLFYSAEWTTHRGHANAFLSFPLKPGPN